MPRHVLRVSDQEEGKRLDVESSLMSGNLPHDSDVTQITVSEKVDIQIILRAVDTASEVTQKTG